MIGIRNYYYPLLLIALFAISGVVYFLLPLIMEHFQIVAFLAWVTLSLWMGYIVWVEYRRRQESESGDREVQE
jgi:membrane protein implicated in regulation of membrane protease activity